MKKVVIIVFILGFQTWGYCQYTSGGNKARADRLKKYSREEMLVKDVKINFDTLTIITLSEEVFYPFTKHNKVEKLISASGLEWYRESITHKFSDTLQVPAFRLFRLDGSQVTLFFSHESELLEIINGFITDTAITILKGIKVNVTKEDVLSVYFEDYPYALASNINVIKIASGMNEIRQIYTIKDNHVRNIGFETDYRYY